MTGIMKRIGMTLIAAILAVVFGAATAQCGQESLSYLGKVPSSRPAPLAWGKDPFVPLVAPEAAVKAGKPVAGQVLRLTAVFFGSLRPSAIINDRIVYVGGTVEGQKVVDIGRTHVILHGVSGRVRLDMAGTPESQ